MLGSLKACQGLHFNFAMMFVRHSGLLEGLLCTHLFLKKQKLRLWLGSRSRGPDGPCSFSFLVVLIVRWVLSAGPPGGESGPAFKLFCPGVYEKICVARLATNHSHFVSFQFSNRPVEASVTPQDEDGERRIYREAPFPQE